MGGGTLSKPLIEMTKTELKQYLSENRNNDEKFSEGMKVLLEKMPPQENWNTPFESLQEGEDFFKKDDI
jgi:hypothetical protein